MTQSQNFKSRAVYKRIVVTGNLCLLTPTALGNGDAESLTDMPLLLDTAGEEPKPLLTGTSIAGALRNYLRSFEKGFSKPELANERSSLTAELFGAVKGDSGNEYDDGGEQSRLIVDDALAEFATHAEVRDGVRINGATRTAEDKFKYDLELLPAGVVFPLRFELLISEHTSEEMLKRALALALTGLETDAIQLGGRKTRGFGHCTVKEWLVTTYDLGKPQELLAWLSADHTDWGYTLSETSLRVGTAQEALGVASLPSDDHRQSFQITATFALASPMLIRSGDPLKLSEAPGDEKERFVEPELVHLRNSHHQPIVSGTSLAGVLRARATRIINTLQVQRNLDSLFGRDMHTKRPANDSSRDGKETEKKTPSASRLIVHESSINGGRTIVQNRIAIDRFTGSALDTALFEEAPQVNGDVELTMIIRDPDSAEKGLLLLLLKDLWTGDLPIGGTSSIGRGCLHGLQATITDGDDEWKMHEQSGKMVIDPAAQAMLEGYVRALRVE